MSGSELSVRVKDYEDRIEDFQSWGDDCCGVGGECVRSELDFSSTWENKRPSDVFMKGGKEIKGQLT
jgi:hypothetical protein